MKMSARNAGIHGTPVYALTISRFQIYRGMMTRAIPTVRINLTVIQRSALISPMNIKEFFKNLWSNTFGANGIPTGGYQVPTSGVPWPDPPPAPPEPPKPPKPPEPSCFAKGIAASIVDEPEAWREVAKDSPLIGYLTSGEAVELCVKHRKTGTVLRMTRIYGNTSPYYICVSPHHDRGSEADGRFLIDTILAHPLGQLVKAQVEKVKQEARRQKAIAHFEKLGCPS
jgi:hypothetical protein